MPSNRGIHVNPIMEEVKWVKPGSILDVGIGFGSMGVLFRQYTDVRLSERNPESYHSWPTKIDGIEVFEWYRNPVWQVYTNVFIGDALQVLDTLGKYDFVYCGDMIEHLSMEDGYKLLDKMMEHTTNWIHVATPSPAPVQNAILGNENERHLSEWKEEDFQKYATENGYICELVGNFFSGQDNMLVVRIKK